MLGNTPFVEVDGIRAKLECVNPAGSVKDRIAKYILTESLRRGLLKPGQRVVEATSGNTGIALAFYGKQLDVPVTIVMPEHMTQERKDLITGLGADLILCSEKGSFAEAALIRDDLAERNGWFNPDQFSNPLNSECHEMTTGQEIIRALGDVTPGAFVAGVGTGGTIIGVGRALKDVYPNLKLIAVEPTEAAVMTGGHAASHQIFGIGDGFIPALASDGRGGVHPMIDEVETISSQNAIAAAQDLKDTHGLCVGVSSGANYAVSKRVSERYKNVVTVFADGYFKYQSCGLQKSAPGRCAFSDRCPSLECASA